MRSHRRPRGRRAAGAAPRRPQRAARPDGTGADHRRRPDPGQPADDPRAGRPGRRVVVLAHLGRPKGAASRRRQLVAAAGRGAARRAARPPGRVRRRRGRAVGRRRPSVSLGDGDVALLENVRFEPAETSKDDAERGAFAGGWPRLADAVRRRRVRRGAPQARQRLRRAAAAPARRRRPGAGRGRGAAPAHRTTRSGRTWWCSAARRCPTSSA